jgi:hypothetical protein
MKGPTMKLDELEPRLLVTDLQPEGTYFRDAESFEKAQCIMFLCPHCFRKNGGPVGTHQVLIWFEGRGVDPAYTPKPRWNVKGTGLGDLTVSPSIRVHGCWHGFITNGEVTFC